MTPQQELDSKIIAEFMEGKFNKGEHSDHSFHTMPKGIPVIEYEKGKKEGFYVVGNLKYHTSWDWLMPVWVKFRELEIPNYDSTFRNKREQRETLDTDREYIGDLIVFGKIEDAFTALSNGIKWYNTIK